MTTGDGARRSTQTTRPARCRAGASACSRTSRRSSTASGRRSGSCSPRWSAAATCCSRTCRERRRRCSPARSPAASRARSPSRIQCTPDLQPTDVTGLSVFNQEPRRFEFQPGPLFANILLVDEINRAMPKTQSALLEAMAEQQVTVDGVTRPLPELVPPDRDREPDRVRGDVPASRGAARPLLRCARASATRARTRSSRIVREQRHGHPLDGACGPSCRSPRSASSAGPARTSTSMSCSTSWIVELVRATRTLDEVEVGASVRGSLALIKIARAWALLHGALYRDPADVEHAVRPGARPPADALARPTSPRRGA